MSSSPASSYSTPPKKSPYDFITGGKQSSARRLLPTGQSSRGRLLLIGGAAAVLLIIIALVGSTLMSGNDSTLPQLKDIAKQQEELKRLSDIGTKKARSAAALNLAVTTKATLESDQSATLAYLKSQKYKVPAKELTLSRNTQTDELFLRAEQANQFDDVFTATIQSKLTTYRMTVKKAYDEASGKKAKQLLSDDYNHVDALMAQKQ